MQMNLDTEHTYGGDSVELNIYANSAADGMELGMLYKQLLEADVQVSRTIGTIPQLSIAIKVKTIPEVVKSIKRQLKEKT